MKLQAWLDKNKKSRTWFGKQFHPKPVSPSTVDGWCNEPTHMPNKAHREEIARITNNQVTGKDFF